MARRTQYDNLPPDKPNPTPSDIFTDDKREVGYGVVKDGTNFIVRYQKPEVAQHIARLLIKHNMDYEAAATAMVKERDEVSDEQIVKIARILERAPQIQNALQERLKEIGLDDGAQKLLVSLAWNVALDRRAKDRLTAMKILGEWSGMGKKAGQQKPDQLIGDDVAEGLKKMGLGASEEDAPEPELEEEE